MSEPTTKGLGALEKHAATKTNEELVKKLKSTPTYVIKSAKQVLEANPTPPTEIWGGIYLNNDINQIIGPSGIGKSRIMLNLAVRQCLAGTQEVVRDENGKLVAPEFAGLPLHRGEVKWLLIGTENDINRYHYDLKKMTTFCTPEQLDVLDKRLFMMTLEGEGDTYIAVDGDMADDDGTQITNFMKLRAAIAQFEPNVVVFDPWGDLIGGSELDDRVVRDTIATLRKLKQGIMDQLTIIIVNHARNGLAEAVKAIGLDAANYGKNSKALYTISRCVWNLAFLEDALNSKVVAVINAKRSNGPLYSPSRAVRLNHEYMTYDTLWDIDVDDRMRNLHSEATKPEQNKAEVRAKEGKDMKKIVCDIVKEALKEGVKPKSSIEGLIVTAGVSDRNINRMLSLAMDELGYKAYSNPLEKNATYYGTPEAIDAFRAQIEKQQAEKAGKECLAPKKRGRPKKNIPPEK